MSRTVRRKQFNHNITREWNSYTEWFKNWFRRRYPNMTDEEIIHRKNVEFHCDNHPGEWCPPSDYGKHLNRRVRNKNVQLLMNSLKYDEEFVEYPIKRDAGYQYF